MLNSERGEIETKEEEMPKPRKKVKVKPYKRRAIGHVRKSVTVRGHHRSLPKPKKKRRKR
jgi:hypothetical protein